ncbi:MAG: hypothetical protein QM539_05125 [Alphaproteobacteria bacterium]|nr:hypothetical protein [Alphaproteobacteria bacterium]
MIIIIKQIFRLFGIIFLQTILINTSFLESVYFFPYIYFAFILWLPLNTDLYFTTIIAFVLGLFMDCVFGVFGVHALACVVVNLIRIQFISLTFKDKRELNNREPSFTSFNVNTYSFFIVFACCIHSLTIFLIEGLKNSFSFQLTLNFIFTTIFSCTALFILDLLFRRHASKYGR